MPKIEDAAPKEGESPLEFIGRVYPDASEERVVQELSMALYDIAENRRRPGATDRNGPNYRAVGQLLCRFYPQAERWAVEAQKQQEISTREADTLAREIEAREVAFIKSLK